MRYRISRRDFVKIGTLSTIAITHKSALSMPDKGKLPIIVCSRGENWGKKVLEPAWAVWQKTRNMLDAVETGANVVELDPEDDSVGYGGLPNEEGVVELDACVMSGPRHNCGAVAGLRDIKRACSVARLVMERTDHIMLVGEGAKRFALAHGFREENLLTEESRKQWLRWKENLSDRDDWLPPKKAREERPTGTINVLGIDDKGDVFGITTTSGLAYKIPGRVGDSPIIGAGLYVDNQVGAAGATGRGEEVIRTCGSFFVVEKMREGMSPQKACEFGCRRVIEVNEGNVNFNVKFIAVNKNGEAGCAQLRDYGKKDCSFITTEGFTAIKAKIVK